MLKLDPGEHLVLQILDFNTVLKHLIEPISNISRAAVGISKQENTKMDRTRIGTLCLNG